MLLAGNVGLQDLQNLQRQLDEKTIECESLEGSLDRAMEQTLWANNDAEMWQGAYYQTVSAERENAQLLYENRQLKVEVEQALAEAARAGESPSVFLECHSHQQLATTCYTRVNRCLPPNMLCMTGRAVFAPLAFVQSHLPPANQTNMLFHIHKQYTW